MGEGPLTRQYPRTQQGRQTCGCGPHVQNAHPALTQPHTSQDGSPGGPQLLPVKKARTATTVACLDDVARALSFPSSCQTSHPDLSLPDSIAELVLRLDQENVDGDLPRPPLSELHSSRDDNSNATTRLLFPTRCDPALPPFVAYGREPYPRADLGCGLGNPAPIRARPLAHMVSIDVAPFSDIVPLSGWKGVEPTILPCSRVG